MKTNRFTILIGTISLIIFWSCSPEQTVTKEKKQFVISDSLLSTLKIDTVQICPVVYDLVLSGQITFNENKIAKIFPLVSGNLTGVSVQEGDYVTKGQLLGVIRSTEMADYGNEVINAKANLLIAKRNLDASEEMAHSGLISDKDLFTARQMFQQAQAQLTRADDILKVNGGNMEGEYLLRAPVSGFIVDKNVNNQMVIRPDNDGDLFTIADLNEVWVMANVYESNIGQVHQGDPVEVTTLSYPGKVFEGKIDKILNVLDENNRVMKIRVVLPNPGYLLKPRMFAGVNVVNETSESALCVPSSAIVFEDNQHYVMIYKSADNVIVRPVEIISTHGQKTYVKGDVQDGDRVIGSDAVLLFNALND